MPEPAKPAAKKKEVKKAEPKDVKKEEPKTEAPAEQAPGVEEKGDPSTESEGVFIKKPENVLIHCGSDVSVCVQLNGAKLPCKPSIKWFKGKWLELGIKSGLRFQFKEDFDKEKNVSPCRKGG